MGAESSKTTQEVVVQPEDVTLSNATSEAQPDRGTSKPGAANPSPSSSAHGGNNFPNGAPVPGGSMHGGTSMWDWGAGRKSGPASTNPSAHGGNNFAGDSRHGGKSMWDWGDGRASPAASTNPSAHAGNNFGPGAGTPGNSAHGGVSFWNWGAGRKTPPASTNASLYGANNFGPAEGGRRENGSRHGGSAFGGGILKGGNSSMHGNNNWPGTSPASERATSRPGSVHGGVHFGPKTDLTKSRERTGSISGDLWNWGKGRQVPDDPSEPAPAPDGGDGRLTPTGNGMGQRKQSFLWDWGLGRDTPPQTPAPSEPNSREGSVHKGDRARFSRTNSLSNLWNWSLGRDAPPETPDGSREGSREGSMHKGDMEAEMGKQMPWAIKMKYGSDGERPV